MDTLTPVILALVGVLTPYLLSTLHSPAALLKLKKSLPALRTIRDALISVITAIEGTVGARKKLVRSKARIKGSKKNHRRRNR